MPQYQQVPLTDTLNDDDLLLFWKTNFGANRNIAFDDFFNVITGKVSTLNYDDALILYNQAIAAASDAEEFANQSAESANESADSARESAESAAAASAYQAKIEVATIAALRALSVSSYNSGDVAVVRGYASSGDGGGSMFYLDKSSSEADNGGTIIAPTGGGGRWKIIQPLVMSLRQWGAVGDFNTQTETGTDDSAALQAALNWWAGDSGRTLEIPQGNYRINAAVRCSTAETRLGKLIGKGGILISTISPVAGTGTISVSSGSNYSTVTGSGTNFTTALTEGDHIVISGTSYTVLSIQSNTSMRLYEQNVTVSAGTTFTIVKPMIQLYATGNAKRPEIIGLFTQSASNYVGGVLFQLMGQNGGAQNWDGFTIRDYRSFCGNSCGLETGRGCFEGRIEGAEISANSGTSTSDLIRILETYGTGDSSSIEVRSPNLRAGRRGIFCTVSDVWIYAATIILTRLEGLRWENCAGGIYGLHLENNWLSDSGTPTPTHAGATLITGAGFYCTIDSVYCVTGSTSGTGMMHALNVSMSGGHITVNAARLVDLAGNGMNLAYCSGSSDASLMISASTGQVTDNQSGTGIVITRDSGRTLMHNLFATRTQVRSMQTPTPFDLTRGGCMEVSDITSNFTISNPSGFTPANGTELTIVLRPESTGGRTVSFDTDYRTTAALSTTANKTTVIRFIRATNVLMEIGRTVV